MVAAALCPPPPAHHPASADHSVAPWPAAGLGLKDKGKGLRMEFNRKI